MLRLILSRLVDAIPTIILVLILVFVSLRILDKNDREIRYESLVPPIDPTTIHPVGHGLLKVSHRRLDEVRTTEFWPVSAHDLEAALQNDRGGGSARGKLNTSSAMRRQGPRMPAG